MAASPSLERPLGPQELLFSELNRRGNGGVQLTVLAEFDRPVDEGALHEALKAVHARHPMLRARIDDRERPWWCCDVPFERIDVRGQPMGAAFDPEAFYATEAAIPLDLGRVSWRAVLLTDTRDRVAWLALTTNHGAIDGRSALVVLNDVDRFLADPAGWEDGGLPLTPSAEEGLAAAGHTGGLGVLPPWPSPVYWAVERPAAAAARCPRVLFRLFPANELETLHRRLHGQGVSLAAGFYAAAAKAAEGLPGANDWLGILAPTDVRADCRPPIEADAVGEYTAAISLLMEPGQRRLSLLETARLLAGQLHDKRPAALRLDAAAKPADIRRQADALAAAANRFGSGLCVSDVGELDRISGRRVGVARILLMASQNHGAHPMLVAIVSTHVGACFSIGYDEPLSSEATARAFAERYLDALATLVRTA